jgi:hypothetical protein
MNLDVAEWKSFKIGALFTIVNGKGITIDEINDNKGYVAAVQSGEDNNGVLGWIDKSYCHSKGYSITSKPCLTVARSGSAGFVAYQPNGCVVGDSAKILLLDDQYASETSYLFLLTILRANRFKYAYGRKVTEIKYANDTIKLPVLRDRLGAPIIDGSKKFSEEGFQPDWNFMKEYIGSLKCKPLTTRNRAKRQNALHIEKWKRFCLGKLFEIYKGKRLTAEDQVEGTTLYIGAIDSNNGVANRIGQSPIHQGNTISLSYNGSVGEAFYQPEPYWATDDVNALYPKFNEFNASIGLFLTSVIRQEKFKFSYGRKWTLENMRATQICLPIRVDEQGRPICDPQRKYSDNGYIPDWEYMKKFIESLPYGDKLKALTGVMHGDGKNARQKRNSCRRERRTK